MFFLRHAIVILFLIVTYNNIYCYEEFADATITVLDLKMRDETVTANMTNENVSTANTTAANMTSENVSTANTTAANMTSKNVSTANTTAANMTNENVTTANTTAANMTNENVTTANTTAANMTNENVTTSNSFIEKKLMTEGWKLEKVKTPSGAPVLIFSLKYSTAKCGEKAQLIYLHKNGTVGWKEHELVSSVVENSKGPGCFQILKIRKIKNGCLWNRYTSRREDIMSEFGATDPNERLLFHGTKDHIWKSTTNGFDERLTSVGSFGAGIYFTDKFSVADTIDEKCPDCLRKVLLCRVMLGKAYEATSNRFYPHAPVGHHSVIARPPGSTHGIYVVYRGEQVYPEYVITYKACDNVTTPAPKRWRFFGLFSWSS